METVVLRSHNPLRHQQFFAPPHLWKSNQCRPCRRKQSRTAARQSLMSTPSPAKKLVMEQVRILKRGEDLRPIARTFAGIQDDGDLVLVSTDPDSVRRQVRVSDLYAGAACLPSPPPSSLPFPSALVRDVGRLAICGGC